MWIYASLLQKTCVRVGECLFRKFRGQKVQELLKDSLQSASAFFIKETPRPKDFLDPDK